MTTPRSAFPSSLSALFLSLVLAPHATGQAYTAESFESPRINLGPLAGADLSSGQDGWILLDSGAYPPNLSAATVQTNVVRSGQQAVRYDASLLSPGAFGELRVNAPFMLTTGVLESEMDFMITSSPSPSSAWEFYTQPFPSPASAQCRWWIDQSGRLDFYDTPGRVIVQTSQIVSRDVWHHARTVIDITNDRFEIFIDEVLVGSGRPISSPPSFPGHGFTQIDCVGAGTDTFFLDNFTVRERRASQGLTIDLPRLPINVRSQMQLRLAGGAALAGRTYVLLGSASGTTPGVPVGSVVLPLNPDWFLHFVGSIGMPGFIGTFNSDGNAVATFDTLTPVPAGLLGLDLDFAYATVVPTDAASEPARVRISL